MGRFVLVERFLDGAEQDHDLAPYSDKDKAFRALKALMIAAPELYGSMRPIRKLLVLEAKYEPQHAALPKRVPGASYALSIAPEPVETEHHLEHETLEAT